MMPNLSSNLNSYADWQRVAREFSRADLQPHPKTTEVMSYFSDDAVFSQPNYPFSVGKTIASIAFKFLCENSTIAFKNIPEIHFEQKEDHILWSFKSMQLRKGLLPEWIRSPQWYQIENKVKIYFTGEGQNTKISRFETLVNNWQPC